MFPAALSAQCPLNMKQNQTKCTSVCLPLRGSKVAEVCLVFLWWHEALNSFARFIIDLLLYQVSGWANIQHTHTHTQGYAVQGLLFSTIFGCNIRTGCWSGNMGAHPFFPVDTWGTATEKSHRKGHYCPMGPVRRKTWTFFFHHMHRVSSFIKINAPPSWTLRASHWHQDRINTWHGRLPRGRHLTALSSCRFIHVALAHLSLSTSRAASPRCTRPVSRAASKIKVFAVNLRSYLALFPPPFIPAAGTRVPPAVWAVPELRGPAAPLHPAVPPRAGVGLPAHHSQQGSPEQRLHRSPPAGHVQPGGWRLFSNVFSLNSTSAAGMSRPFSWVCIHGHPAAADSLSH